MLKATLTKVKSNHDNLRTDVIEGKITHLPEVGQLFVILAPALEEGDFRVVYTTLVTFVEQMDKSFTFNTVNSIYKLEVTDTDKNLEDYKRV